MADLNAFTVDITAVRDGEWVTVGRGENAFEIRTRGFTPAYRDNLNVLRRQASRDANRKIRPGDLPFMPDTLPPSVDDKCQGQALADFCTLDVRGLTSGGVAITADEFKDMLREPEGRQGLLVLAIGAAARVGSDRQAEKETAQGN